MSSRIARTLPVLLTVLLSVPAANACEVCAFYTFLDAKEALDQTTKAQIAQFKMLVDAAEKDKNDAMTKLAAAEQNVKDVKLENTTIVTQYTEEINNIRTQHAAELSEKDTIISVEFYEARQIPAQNGNEAMNPLTPGIPMLVKPPMMKANPTHGITLMNPPRLGISRVCARS